MVTYQLGSAEVRAGEQAPVYAIDAARTGSTVSGAAEEKGNPRARLRLSFTSKARDDS
jgi:hypothetical protein